MVDRSQTVELDDFIELQGSGFRGPRGFVTGEGTLGKNGLPVWKIKGPHGETNLVPKDDTRLIAKSEGFYKQLAAQPGLMSGLFKNPQTVGQGGGSSETERRIAQQTAARIAYQKASFLSQQRSKRAQAADERIQAQTVAPRIAQSEQELALQRHYFKHPSQSDFEDVDTPGQLRPLRVRGMPRRRRL